MERLKLEDGRISWSEGHDHQKYLDQWSCDVGMIFEYAGKDLYEKAYFVKV